MQGINWNDLRYLLAIKRGRTLAAAARLMAVDGTTVARRLAALRTALGDDLYLRQDDGTLVLTEHGSAIASHAEEIEQQTDRICELANADSDTCSGTVRVTSVPVLINRWLTPRLNVLLDDHPNLQIDLIPDSRNLSLSMRETDIALRLARPTVGGHDTLARRIGHLAFGVFAAPDSTGTAPAAAPWIGYGDLMSHLPQARATAKAARPSGEALAGLRVYDLETAIEAASAGLGKALLPVPIARDNPALQRLDKGPAQVSRELWLLTHRSQQAVQRINIVTQWIESLVEPL